MFEYTVFDQLTILLIKILREQSTSSEVSWNGIQHVCGAYEEDVATLDRGSAGSWVLSELGVQECLTMLDRSDKYLEIQICQKKCEAKMQSTGTSK